MAGSGSSSSRTRRRRRAPAAAVAPDDVGSTERGNEPELELDTDPQAVDVDVHDVDVHDDTQVDLDLAEGDDEEGDGDGVAGARDTTAPVEFDASTLLDELGPAPLFDLEVYDADDLFADRLAGAAAEEPAEVMWPRTVDDEVAARNGTHREFADRDLTDRDLVGPGDGSADSPASEEVDRTATTPAFAPAEPPPVLLAAAAPPLVVPSRRQRLAARRLQARRVGRIVWHVDLWSLLKVALLFWLCAMVILVLALVALWSVLQRTGVVGNVEQFVVDAFALETFAFDGPLMFRLVVVAGLALAAATTLLTVVLGLMFNLISDLVGGIRLTVVEEESARPIRPRRRSPRRSTRVDAP